MTDKNVLTTLEYDKVLKRAAEYCVTLPAQEKMTKTMPAAEKKDAVYLLELTAQSLLMLNERAGSPIQGFDCAMEVLVLAEKGIVLSIPQLQRVLRLLKASRGLKTSIIGFSDARAGLLHKIANGITVFDTLQSALSSAIISESELSDNASPKLSAIRSKISIQKGRIKSRLNSYTKGAEYSKYLQDNYFTVRNERFVIPVKSEYKGTISGLLHDVSASGSTMFIEPIEIVESNNKLREALVEEQEEIKRILAEFSAQIGGIAQQLKTNQDICVDCDIIFAKAQYASATRSVKPLFSENRNYTCLKARHPLLDPVKVVPIDIVFDKNVLLISGPNTGGKTVALKSIGILALMAASGFYLPAIDAVLPFFEKVYCDIGDRQSIEDSLSTFSSHITNLKHIMSNADGSSLVLLDELGSGTDPQEGAALAVSVLSAVIKTKAKCVITTHYSELKEFGLEHGSDIVNASMEFDPKTFLPTYKLRSGLPGVSNAIAIARHLGLDSNIIQDAERYLGQGRRSFERVLLLADAARQQAEAEREQIKKEREEFQKEVDNLILERKRLDTEYENLNYKAKLKVDKIMENARGHADEILDEMAELLKTVNAENLFKAKQLKHGLEYSVEEQHAHLEYDPLNIESIQIGKPAIIKSLGTSGIIKSLPNEKKEVDIAVGNMIIKINVDKLGIERFTKSPHTDTNKKAVSHSVEKNSENNTAEINLLGQSVDEAVLNVDRFIDQSLMQGFITLRIIHGIGTGALRSGLHRYFKTHKQIKEYRIGGYGEGGSGVTVVTLKTT